MIPRGWWVYSFHSAILLWNECGEDPFIFCYRISQGAFVVVYRRTAARLPSRPLRTKPDCSTPSASLSTTYTTLKD